MTPEEFLANARDKAITDATYLAACDTGTLTWYRGVNGSAQLVTKEDKRKTEEALAIRRADPQGNHPEPPPPEPAVLSMIAHIPTFGFFMTSCGMWQGPKTAAKTFAELSATLAVAAPKQGGSLRYLDEDFTVVLAKLLELRSEGATQEDYRGIFRSLGSEEDKSSLRLRHVFFEDARNFSPEERAERLDALAPGPAFILENWPLPVHEEARAALREMQNTGDYIARPLFARDRNGVAIEPDAYKRQLQDCVALVHFTLSRFSFPTRVDDAAHDQFVADIERIRVLDEPYLVKHPNAPPTPNKRKATRFTLTENDDSDGSPKKARIGGVDVASA
ncbi:hypothetical protein C8J57DRAFT_509158 [Mycena rebaudengoi]|nr:hypothetical protein C8J57DRAFT_509158 [Mycena rebaudengoi]